MRARGFTLIELLVTITCIVILSLIIFRGVYYAIDKAKITKATAELKNLQTRVIAMALDTRRWPNGCLSGTVLPFSNSSTINEVVLSGPAAGLVSTPVLNSGDTDNAALGCGWDQTSISNWKGPYYPATESLLDPWGQPYWFDNDYAPRRDCPNYRSNAATPQASYAALVSGGPNLHNGAWDSAANQAWSDANPGWAASHGTATTATYDCDDIYVLLNPNPNVAG